VARAVHGLGPVPDPLHLHGPEHVLLEVLQVPGDLEEALAHDVGGVDDLVPVLQDELLLVLLDCVSDDGARGLPENEPGTHPTVGGEEIELPPQSPVVPLLRLLQAHEVLLELLVAEEGRSVDALEHLPALVPRQ
jgi:hypothetical protein